MNLSKYNIDVENEAEDARIFDPLPDGHYEAIITKSEMKETKAGNGEFLALTFEIIDGDFEGRLAWANINLRNANDTVERIGRSQLASICKAVGIMNPQESEELHDKPLVITVRRDKKDNTRNVIKGYASADGTHAEAPAESKPEPKPEPKAEPKAEPKEEPRPRKAVGEKPWNKRK